MTSIVKVHCDEHLSNTVKVGTRYLGIIHVEMDPYLGVASGSQEEISRSCHQRVVADACGIAFLSLSDRLVTVCTRGSERVAQAANRLMIRLEWLILYRCCQPLLNVDLLSAE